MDEEIQPKPYKISYDPNDNIIELDMTDLDATIELTAEIFDELIRLAKTRPNELYVLSGWKNVRMPPEVREYYAIRIKEIAPLIKGATRYDVNVFVTKVGIKISNMYFKKTTDVFDSREEALEAIRSGKVGEQEPTIEGAKNA